MAGAAPPGRQQQFVAAAVARRSHDRFRVEPGGGGGLDQRVGVGQVKAAAERQPAGGQDEGWAPAAFDGERRDSGGRPPVA